jgi:3-hydroxyisobutyrate dehydrogenase
MAEKSDVGIVGTGEMGSRMAAVLLDAGHPVGVFDADKERQDDFARHHQCRSAATLGELGQGVDYLITMLPDGNAVRNAYLETEDGALMKSLKPGCIAIDTSSADPLGTRRLSKMLAERDVALIDAPVSGGITGAETGNLVFMVGGDDDAAVEKAAEILDTLGQRSFRCGRSGNGHAMKCLNNYMSSTGFQAGVEALLIGKRFGLDPSAMVDVLNVSTGHNHATANTLKQETISRNFATKFALALMAKDVNIAATLAEDLHINAPLVRQSQALIGRANTFVGPGADHTEAVKYWEMLNEMSLSDDA